MNQKENNEDNKETKNKKDDNNLDNKGCFYSILFWLGLWLIASFIGSLSPSTKSLVGYLVFAIVVFGFLFWAGVDKGIERAMGAILVIFVIFILGALISQCSPSRYEPYDDYLEGVRR